MADFPTPQETAQFVDGLLRNEIDPTGTGAYNNQAGSDNAKLISVLTKVSTKQYAYSADRKKASITASAEGVDLEDHIRDVYFDQKKEENEAVGTVYLQRSGAMPATSIQVGSRFGTKKTDSQNAVPFEATATIPAGSGVSKVAVPVKCQVDGVVGNVDLDAITEKMDPLDDPAWTLYVPIAGDPVLGGAPAPDSIGGGAEQETDDEVKTRVLRRPARVSPGTAAGVYKGATDVGGIASAVPVEVGDGTGVVFCGDINDQLPSAIQSQVSVNLDDWRPFGVPVNVRGYSRVRVSVALRIFMQKPLKDFNKNTLLANAVAAVKRYFLVERLHLDEYFVDAIKTSAAKSNAQTQSVIADSPMQDVRRSTDAAYGAATQMTRYYVDDTSISIQFFDPLTS